MTLHIFLTYHKSRIPIFQEISHSNFSYFFTDVELFAALIKRETEKEKRTEQNDVIIELNPLVVSLHLGSMKIFFNNIKTEEKTADGEYLGELDQKMTLRYYKV